MNVAHGVGEPRTADPGQRRRGDSADEQRPPYLAQALVLRRGRIVVLAVELALLLPGHLLLGLLLLLRLLLGLHAHRRGRLRLRLHGRCALARLTAVLVGLVTVVHGVALGHGLLLLQRRNARSPFGRTHSARSTLLYTRRNSCLATFVGLNVLSLVFSITSAGKCGGLPWRSQLAVSQSRTNCLSKLGWSLPASYSSPGQKRDESGVSTSSARIDPAVRRAELELRVGDDHAALGRMVARRRVHLAAPGRAAAAASSSPTISTRRSKLMFSSWSPISAFVDGVKMGSGSFEEFTRPAGSSMPHTRALLLVLLEAAAGQIAAHDALGREHVGLLHQHEATAQVVGVRA